MDTQFSSRVFWSDEDEGYIAIVPEMPNISAFGETREEAVKELRIALRLTLETLQEDGIELPSPKKLPTHSGQLRIRIPSYLHTQLAQRAEDEGISLNSLITAKLAQEDSISEQILAQLARIESELVSLKDKQIATAENVVALHMASVFKYRDSGPLQHSSSPKIPVKFSFGMR